MLLKNLINKYVKKFEKQGINESLLDINYIISEALNIKKNEFFFFKDLYIEKSKVKVLESLLEKRLSRIPVQRIFKKTYFRDFILHLNDFNFIPRSDSELVIEILKTKRIYPNKVLDLGTGSGAIIISVLKSFERAKGLATDISYESIYMAKKNAILNKVNKRLNFICCNWLDAFANIEFDLIISNPPYIETRVIESLDPEVKTYDPMLALDGGIDGLKAYRDILSGLKLASRKSTLILFEMGHDQADSLAKIMRSKGLKNIEVFNDYTHKSRFIMGLKE